MWRAVGVALVLVLAGAPPAPAAVLRTKLHRPRRGVQVRLSPITIAPRDEREVCQAITVPARHSIDIDRIEIAMPSGLHYSSHHFAIFFYDGDAPGLPTQPVDSVGCAGIGQQLVGAIVAFVQRPAERIRFPAGVGIRLRGGQRLLLNAHYINGSDAPVTIDVAANFRAARKGTIRHHARSFQLGTFGIHVPPGADGSAVADWRTPFPMNVVWLSTHSHKHTRSVDVDLLRGAAIGPLLLETTSYSEPTVKTYDGVANHLRLEPGDGLHWTCNYHNDTARPLRFGVKSDDEMCFTVGFFYPDDDLVPLPPVPACFGAGEGLVCPGEFSDATRSR